ESTRSDFIEFDREVLNIKNYLALQKLRFTDKFDYKIEVDEKIDSEGIEIPPMLIQPFVENAIEHGIKTKEMKGNIDIRFKLNGDQIRCTIDDDGVGRTIAGRQFRKGHTSMATEIVHDRLETLGKKLKQKLNLEIIDMKTEANVSLGTRVIIGLPYRES
ncbi:MAG: sensor histidine kinase, partial [Marinilabiliales bacterium]